MQTDPATLKVRPYARADRQPCLELFDGNTPAFFDPSEREDFHRWLDDPPGTYLVLTTPRGSVVACGGWARRREAGAVDLCWGMVRSELRGRGIGRLLTETRLAHIDADPRIEVVYLFTTQHSAGFYERLGFEVTARVSDGIGPGLDHVDMRRVRAPSPLDAAPGAP